jgi:hypothetical protein
MKNLRRLKLDVQVNPVLTDAAASLETLEFLDLSMGMWIWQPLKRLVEGPKSNMKNLKELAVYNQIVQPEDLDMFALLPSLRVLRPKMIVGEALNCQRCFRTSLRSP